jgi:hypothetical protein
MTVGSPFTSTNECPLRGTFKLGRRSTWIFTTGHLPALLPCGAATSGNNVKRLYMIRMYLTNWRSYESVNQFNKDLGLMNHGKSSHNQ